jgi:hypothetical protein
VAFVYRLLRTAEGPTGWLSAGTLGGGLVTVAVQVGSLAPVFAADARAGVLTPELAWTLDDLGGGAFAASWFPQGIFLLGVAAAGLRTRALPAVLCWADGLIGRGCVPGTARRSPGPRCCRTCCRCSGS